MGCACSLSGDGARQAKPQTSQAWLKHPVFQAWARGEGRGEKGEKREGWGECGGGTEWPIVCVEVFLCAHVGGSIQCVTCVPDL